MDKLGLGLDDETTPQDGPKDPKEQRKASIEKCIRYLVHATKCHDPHCKQPSCIKMKRVLTHTRECKLMLSNKWNICKICKQFVLLCISHAKNCNEDKCPVPVCARIKKNLRDQRNQQSVQRQRFMQQRMALMNVNQSSVVNTNNVASPATNTSPPNPSPAKGSPANYPPNTANNSPAAVTASPAGAPAGGKGGPRTPASDPMSGKAPRMTTGSVPSPAVQSVPPPVASTGKTEQNMPAPNVTVGATTGLPGELKIQRVPQNPGAGMPQRAMGATMMQRTQPGTQLPHDMMSQQPTAASMSTQYAMSAMQQPNMAMRMQNPAYHPAAAQQMMSRQQQYHQYRSMAPNMQSHMTQQRMISQGQVFHQQPQQHARSQLQQMLQAGPPQQQYAAAQYGSPQMAHPHTNRPPPQYPMPQTAGYPQVLGQGRPMAGPMTQMGQHMSQPMHHQYGGMAQMDPAGGMQTADPSSYMYQQQYGLNNNNNNSYQQDQVGLSAMTPTDRLSRFAESL